MFSIGRIIFLSIDCPSCGGGFIHLVNFVLNVSIHPNASTVSGLITTSGSFISSGDSSCFISSCFGSCFISSIGMIIFVSIDCPNYGGGTLLFCFILNSSRHFIIFSCEIISSDFVICISLGH